MVKIPAVTEVEGQSFPTLHPDDTLIDQVTYLLELADQNYADYAPGDADENPAAFNLIDAVKLINTAIERFGDTYG